MYTLLSNILHNLSITFSPRPRPKKSSNSNNNNKNEYKIEFYDFEVSDR